MEHLLAQTATSRSKKNKQGCFFEKQVGLYICFTEYESFCS